MIHPADSPLDPHAASLSSVRSVMFVCLGNICRSPLAQGVFEHLATERGVRERLTIASCGTGHWHVGDPPDPRSIAVARKNGVSLRSRGRQLNPASDFASFDLLVPMDRSNLHDLLRAGCPRDRARLLLAFAPEGRLAAHEEALRTQEVPDPYHGSARDFDRVFEMIRAGAEGLLNAIMGRPDARA